MPLFFGGEKVADTELLPHQQRVVDKIQNQSGLLVYHKMGKGKCVDGETLIQTSEGIFSIRELFSSFSSIDADEIFAPPAKPLFVNSFQKESIEWKKVRNLYRQKINEPLINVKTHRGNSIKVTQEHPFLVARQEGLVWVKSSQLRIGDYICMASYINSTHNLCLGQDLPSLLAWQITEGWESSKKYACSITQKGEGCFILQDLAQKVLKSTVKIQKPKKGCTFIRFYSNAYGNLLTSLGYEWGHKSANKKMPSAFSCLDRPTMAKFLQIMFDAEGHAGTCGVEFSSASKRLIEQVKSLLLVFGIRSSFSVMRKCATNGSRIYRTYYRIMISGEDLRIFEKEIKFFYKYKNDVLEKSVSKKHNPNTGIPYISNIQNLIKLGATNSMFNLSDHQKNTISKDRAKKLIKKLEHFLWDFDFTKNLKGTAGNFYKRTCAFITNNRSSILDSKTDLERLCRLPIRYELVEELAETKSSDTYVYDLEIDSDVYDEKNYIAGSGGFVVHNTVSALSSMKKLNKPSTVITPAALKSNFLQEQEKHLDTKLPMDMDTLENVARKQTGKKNPVLVVDEAHRARTPGSKTLSALKNISSDAEKTMLLTGTPMVNGPSDIAPLINIVSKEKLLPEAKDEFEKKYVYNKKINPSFLQRLEGIKPGEKQVVNKHETENLRNIFSKWVDYEPGSTEGFPSVEEHDIEVPMSKKQLAIYDSLMGTAPPWVAAKVRSNLPPNKQEAISLNKYLSGARQVGNTPRGFTTEEIDSPKIQRAYEELKKILDVDPQNKGVVYSNFLESGLSPYGDLLKKENILFGEISGRVPQATRDQHVKDYNEGKLRALLLSPAAQQGLNLKGSTLMQLLDPAWNEPSLDQAKARAIRYQSHAHLPEEKRKVLVQKFLATRPKSLLQRMGVTDKEYAVDEYLKNLSRNKAELVGQFEDLMRPQEKLAGVIQSIENWQKSNMEDDSMDEEQVRKRVQDLMKKMDIKKPFDVNISEHSPSVEILPQKDQSIKKILRLSPKTSDAFISHELGHLKNYDDVGDEETMSILNKRMGGLLGIGLLAGVAPSIGLLPKSKLKYLIPAGIAAGLSYPTLKDEFTASHNAFKNYEQETGSKYEALKKSKSLIPAFGSYLLAPTIPVAGVGLGSLLYKGVQKLGKIEDKVKQFNETKDYNLVLKNVSSPKFRKLLIQASDDPRFHNFLNNAGKHFSGREKEKHQVESATKKNTVYDVKLHKDGSYTCSCPNYLYKQGPDNGECKHIVGLKGKR